MTDREAEGARRMGSVGRGTGSGSRVPVLDLGVDQVGEAGDGEGPVGDAGRAQHELEVPAAGARDLVRLDEQRDPVAAQIAGGR